MKILGIETSCDETAASVVQNGTKILSNVVHSQIDLHAAYGGVVPEIAARSHIETILPVIHEATKNTGYDAIAVTHTPGLNGSLLIGTLTARTLTLLTGKPLYPTHHIKSHIYANWLSEKSFPQFPILSLVISGGHTQLIYMKSHNNFEIIGTTLDDAVGEAFDKVAKILGLPYPGGPSIAAAASKANGHQQGILNSREKTPAGGSFPGEESCLADAHSPYSLPIPKVAGLDFSFSGLKTATLRAVQKAVGVPISTPSTELAALLTDEQRHNFAASFQATAIQILLEKLALAIQTYHPNSIVLGGGVSANKELRKRVSEVDFWRIKPSAAGENHRSAVKRTSGQDEIFAARNVSKDQPLKLYFPEPKFCGDNAAMVASAAYFAIKAGQKPTDPLILDISPHSTIS